MCEVFDEIWRVLRKDGTVWLNIGDTYISAPPGNTRPVEDRDGAYQRRNSRQTGHGEDIDSIYAKNRPENRPQSDYRPHRGGKGERQGGDAGKQAYLDAAVSGPNRRPVRGLKNKDLVGIPWLLAFALRARGWWLRQEIIWQKPNPIPESTKDRCTKAHEQIFLLAKSGSTQFWNRTDGAYHERVFTRPEPDYRWILRDKGMSPMVVAVRPPEDIEHPGRYWKRINLWRGWDYYFDASAIEEPASSSEDEIARAGTSPGMSGGKSYAGAGESTRRFRTAGNRNHKYVEAYASSQSEELRTKAGLMLIADQVYMTRNKRSVWTVPSRPFKGAHFATFPPDLIEPCVLAGCPPDGVILDPFGGSGTVGMVAQKHGRRAILIEKNPEYVAIAVARITEGVPLMAAALVEVEEQLMEAAE